MNSYKKAVTMNPILEDVQIFQEIKELAPGGGEAGSDSDEEDDPDVRRLKSISNDDTADDDMKRL